MYLTPEGARLARLAPAQRFAVAERLIRGYIDILQCMKGVCYDAAAYCRYMGGPNILVNELIDIYAQNWLPKFNFAAGTRWDGRFSLPLGKAIGFYRVAPSPGFFHAGIAFGGPYIRAINSSKLGVGWRRPVNLVDVLGRRKYDGTFDFDGAKILVCISMI